MKSNKIMRVLLVLSSLLLLVGVLIMVWIHFEREKKDVIKVKLSDGETEAVKVEALSLTPGDSCEYTLELEDDTFAKYDLKLKFVDSAPKKTLKDYARVKIVSGETVVYDELLAKAFQNDNLVLPVDLNTGKNAELKIVYYLPLEVGNEAKNAEASFKLLLTASNE